MPILWSIKTDKIYNQIRSFLGPIPRTVDLIPLNAIYQISIDLIITHFRFIYRSLSVPGSLTFDQYSTGNSENHTQIRY